MPNIAGFVRPHTSSSHAMENIQRQKAGR